MEELIEEMKRFGNYESYKKHRAQSKGCRPSRSFILSNTNHVRARKREVKTKKEN